MAAEAANGPAICPSELSKISSTDARPTGLRVFEPLKITSSASAERRFFMLVSPSTQRTASITLDLPQPFGPTTPVRFDGNASCVGSTQDRKTAVSGKSVSVRVDLGGHRI